MGTKLTAVSDRARRLKVRGVHEKTSAIRTSLAGNPGVHPSSEKIEFWGLAKMQFPAVLRAYLHSSVCSWSIFYHYHVLHSSPASTPPCFCANLDEIRDP